MGSKRPDSYLPLIDPALGSTSGFEGRGDPVSQWAEPDEKQHGGVCPETTHLDLDGRRTNHRHRDGSGNRQPDPCPAGLAAHRRHETERRRHGGNAPPLPDVGVIEGHGDRDWQEQRAGCTEIRRRPEGTAETASGERQVNRTHTEELQIRQ